MPAPDEFTGERFLPECTGEIWAEHWHRYLFAAGRVAGLDVLDVACGEGYGSSLLAKHAKSVTGVDIDADTVARARSKYRAPGLRFEAGSVSRLPLPDASFDCVVSFETLEHLAEQEEMLAELRRVLRPEGFIVISTPNKVEYSEKRDFNNEFHVRELYEHEFRELLGRHFGAQQWYGQRLLFNSAMWPLAGVGGAGGAEDGRRAVASTATWVTLETDDRSLPVPMYFVAIAARDSGCFTALPADASLLADPDDTIYREYETTVARVRTLETLVIERERIVVERDRQIAMLDENARQLETVIGERESQLGAHSARAQTMEVLIAERERVIVERDQQLRFVNDMVAACERLIVERDALLQKGNERIVATERLLLARESLIDERDAQLSDTNERLHAAEQLIADRERIIVERDAQLAASAERQQTLESLVGERERLIVERDADLEAVNERVRNIERIIAERDGQLQATNERMALAEKVIAERELEITTREATIAAHAQRIDALDHELARTTQALDGANARTADMERLASQHGKELASLRRVNFELRTEIVRRASWRWWLALPLRRFRKTVPISVDPSAPDA